MCSLSLSLCWRPHPRRTLFAWCIKTAWRKQHNAGLLLPLLLLAGHNKASAHHRFPAGTFLKPADNTMPHAAPHTSPPSPPTYPSLPTYMLYFMGRSQYGTKLKTHLTPPSLSMQNLSSHSVPLHKVPYALTSLFFIS